MNNNINTEQIAQFKEYLTAQERSPATVEKYARDVSALSRFLGGEKQLGQEALMAYKHALTQKYAVGSVNSMLASVNAYLRFIGQGELSLKPLKVQRRIFCAPEEELTREDYLALLQAAERLGKKRLWLLLQTLCATGIRISELKFITMEAAKKHRAAVSCKNKSRFVFLPQELCKALLEYARSQGVTSGSIFITRGGKQLDRSNVWKEMKRLCKPAGVSSNKVFPHNLRHLFARAYYQKQKDVARLADLLGHSSIETTRIYLISTGEEQESQVNSLGLLAS